MQLRNIFHRIKYKIFYHVIWSTFFLLSSGFYKYFPIVWNRDWQSYWKMLFIEPEVKDSTEKYILVLIRRKYGIFSWKFNYFTTKQSLVSWKIFENIQPAVIFPISDRYVQSSLLNPLSREINAFLPFPKAWWFRWIEKNQFVGIVIKSNIYWFLFCWTENHVRCNVCSSSGHHPSTFKINSCNLSSYPAWDFLP